jgi:hypothetical protein
MGSQQLGGSPCSFRPRECEISRYRHGCDPPSSTRGILRFAGWPSWKKFSFFPSLTPQSRFSTSSINSSRGAGLSPVVSLKNHSSTKEGKMKTFIYGLLFVFLTLLSWPTTSDAFSRRSSGSEVAPMQAATTPVTTANNVSAQSVPEPPVLLLMSIGLQYGPFERSHRITVFQ